MSKALAFLKSRPLFAAYGALAALFLSGVGLDSIRGRTGKVAPAGVPILVEASRYARDWETERVTCPPLGIVALKPSSRDLEALAERFKLPDLIDTTRSAEPEAQDSGFRLFKRDAATEALPGDRRILKAFNVPKMPWGGEGLATLRPTGETDVHLLAAPRPRLEIAGQWGFGGLIGQDTEGGRWRAYGFIEPLRLGSVWLRGEAGTEGRESGATAYVLVGAEWRRK